MGRNLYRWWALAAFTLLVLPSPAANAENPRLSAQVGGVDSEKARSSGLRTEMMDISVRLHGGIAETVVTARFHNPGSDQLEGRFTLQMPSGSIVTGYALDVAGGMVEGVLVDQMQARRVYQARVREQIDPGLGEVSRGFEFETRVYPIGPRSARTVRVRFVTPLAPGEGYELPLDSGSEIGRFSLRVEATAGGAPPRVRLPGDREGRLLEEGGTHRLSYHADHARLEGALVVETAPRGASLFLSGGPGGETFFEISDSAPLTNEAVLPPRRVAIYWDQSLSRADDDHEAEMALLQNFLTRTRAAEVELVLFDATRIERSLVEPSNLPRRLRQVDYRGATSLALLTEAASRADMCLLFTDGLITVDRRAGFTPRCPLTVISSAREADRPVLGDIARATGGEALHLTAANRGAILDRLTRRVPRVVSVKSTGGVPIEAVLLDSPAGGWRLVGPMPRSGGVVVSLAGLAPRPVERSYSPVSEAAAWSAAAPLWAAERLAVRAGQAREERQVLLAFARRYSVAGPDISFLVLETGADYAEAGIEPPPTLGAAEIEAYRERVREEEDEIGTAKSGRLEAVVAAWEEQKRWWSTRFDLKAKANPDEIPDRRGNAPELAAPPPPSPVEVGAPQAEPAGPSPVDESINDLPQLRSTDSQSVTVTGTRERRPNLISASPVTVVGVPGESIAPAGEAAEIELSAEWAADRPYLRALKAAAPLDRARVLREQQAVHGALPAFWLDVAEFHRRAGRVDEARLLLLSALELPTRDNETLAIVAERAFRYGEEQRAIELYEMVAAAEPNRPQPLRSLALALAKRAERRSGDAARSDLERAIALLTQVIVTPWPDAYDGIEMIALMEVNRLIPRYRALGGSDVPLDPRLIALLDVDLRIVVEWNTEETDLDLWVDEPNRERAFYGNQATRIGGRMSNDMTDGYGPEEYLLRQAPAGVFTVRADVYSTDSLNPNGASRITGTLIRNFGRSDEREETVEIELLPGEDDEDDDVKLIGKIRVSR